MPIEAVKIPQNVYVEDRIIGPVTLKQLIITGVGAGIGYVLYATAAKAGVASLPVTIFAWSPAVIAGAFAFLKINDLSLFNIILLIIEGMNKPSTRYWSPHPGISINLITRTAAKELTEASAKVSTSAGKLADITRQMEKRQEEMDRLTTHDTPGPKALQPVQTRISEDMKHGVYEHEEVTQKPVRPERVSAEGLDPLKSIDGVGSANRYDHLLHTPS